MARDFKVRPTVNGTDLSLSNEVAPASHVGSRDGHPLATTALDGMMAAADKAKLDELLSVAGPEVSVSAAATLDSSAFGKMHILSGSANYTVALPAASGSAGKVIGFRVASGTTALVTIDGNGAETIDGAATRVMWAQESAVLLCDGTGWIKIGGKSRPMHGAIGGMAALQPVTAGGLVKLPLNTSIANNTGAMVDLTNNRISVLRPATYLLVPQITWSNLTNNVARLLTRVHKNGAYWYQTEHSGLAGAYPGVAAIAPQAVVAGDYLELYAYQLGPGEQNIRHPVGETFLNVLEQPGW